MTHRNPTRSDEPTARHVPGSSTEPDPADRSDPHDRPEPADLDVSVVAWVTASCERQGVGVKVVDAAVVARIAVLLGAPAPASGRARSGRGAGLADGGRGADTALSA